MKKLFLTLTFAIICLLTVVAQDSPAPTTAAEQAEVVESINELLQKNYVFPDVADEMAGHIKKQLEAGAYKNLIRPTAFADQLTQDLQSISKDKHLRVAFNPELVKELQAMKEDEGGEAPEEWIAQMRRNNFGFQEVKLLEGNVGYLDLRGFNDTKFAGETAVAAMNFLANADALIIDLRNNGGGSPSMIQLLTSYLYDAEPVHLNNFYWRPQDETTQTWTLPHVPGKRRPDMDVYVLTSQRTFSAAEEFSYNLKNLKRATLVGETTGGGAHPGGTEVATSRFTVWVPKGRAINPISKTNWEGTGVKPDVEVQASKALDKAHFLALEKLAANEDEAGKLAGWHVALLKAKMDPLEVEPALLASYAGTYGPRQLSFEKGKLYYQREGNPRYELIPLAEDLFFFEEASYFRLKIDRKEGKAIGLIGLYDNGHKDYSARTEKRP